ncbi:MAG: ATP-dependent helicase [Verrucomicrobia bacterium]|nr:MAG: ATP-dependent helicase [Verrucomicrobiota bacterium]
MQIHGPKRVYTQGSLEFWFDRLVHPWDSFFPVDHLKSGRNLYRNGGIREIELGPDDAVVHVKLDGKEEYAVIEWRDRGPTVRSSSPDKVLANSIAVAGLHEIEELVADEIKIMPLEIQVEEKDSDIRMNGASRPEKVEPIRTMILVLTVTDAGLVCDPYWEDGRGQRCKALGSNGNNGNGPSQAERGKVISLTAQARKAHFHFDGDLKAYVLDEISDIPHFVGHVLPGWKKRFRIEEGDSVDRLKNGVRRVEVEARARRGSSDAGLDLEWVFRVGEQLLSSDQVSALSQVSGGAILIPEIGMVTVEPAKLQSVGDWNRSLKVLDLKNLPPYLLFSLFGDQNLKVTVTPQLDAWRKQLAAGPVRLDNLPEFLRPYQQRGVEWLAHLCEHECHGLLADEMGLGKTVQMISLIACRPVKEAQHIVVCPASVVPVWQDEIHKFFPNIPVHILNADNDFLQNRKSGLWIASYAQLRNHRAMLGRKSFGYAILDEGQFIKNPDAKVTNTCFEIQARHRIVLTGTPLENRQLDLWSLFHFLLPGLLGTRQQFEASLGRDRESMVVRLRAQLAPFMLRRTKAQVAKELPPKVETILLSPLTDLQRREYARVCSEGLARLGDDIGKALKEKSFGFLSLLTRLRQICCDPDLLPWLDADPSESGKLNMLVEKLEEAISGGHKVVVFSQFVMLLNRVRGVLQDQFVGLPRFELTGSTLDRQKPVQEFQGMDGPAVMLVSLKAAGTGITLHAADYVFLLDPWWNPAVEEQAVDRVHRLGQTRTVFVYRMVTSGTIEERIQILKGEKKQLFSQIVESKGGQLRFREHFRTLNSLIELEETSED